MRLLFCLNYLNYPDYLNKNYMSETKQNYDGKPNYNALRSIISGQDSST